MQRLKNILRFIAVGPSATVALPHLLRDAENYPLIPDYLDVNPKGMTVTADATNVTVTNTSSGALNIDVLCESWHTIERSFGADQTTDLVPQPFISAGHAGGVGGAPSAAMFYGTTTGTGSEGNDYAATVAVGAPVPFPRDGAAVGLNVDRSGASLTDFIVNATGIYSVAWNIAFAEPSELQLAVVTAGPTYTPIARTTVLSGAGTQLNSNDVLVSLTAGQIIAVINPAGNAAALTVQPADGSRTHAQAPSLVIQQII